MLSANGFQEFLKALVHNSDTLTVWFFQAIAIWITDLCLKKVRITSFFGPILMVIALSFVNSKIWDIALFFQIPNSLTSQAITVFFVNGLIFWALVKILPGIEIEGFVSALIAPIIFTLANLVITYIVKEYDFSDFYSFVVNIFQDIKNYATGTLTNEVAVK